MFNRSEDIIITSLEASMPDSLEKKTKETLTMLFDLVNLLEEKFKLNNVRGRFNKDKPDTFSIILWNAEYDANDMRIDNANEKSFAFLAQFQGKHTKELSAYCYLSDSVITFDTKQLQQITKGLKLLTTPAANPEPRLVILC